MHSLARDMLSGTVPLPDFIAGALSVIVIHRSGILVLCAGRRLKWVALPTNYQCRKHKQQGRVLPKIWRD